MHVLLRCHRYSKILFQTFNCPLMCGNINKKMSVQSTVEELTQACSKLRRQIESSNSQQEREKLVTKHIKTFAEADVRINDFQKGLEWFNVSEGLSIKQHLAGKIVILDFFTYCCINCMHILPDLAAMEKKFSAEDGLVVVGVHSPKFSNEKDSKKILSAVQRYNIMHPVVNDAKMSLWRDIGIICWPSLVVLGPMGQLLAVLIGEGHREELFLYTKMAIAYFKSTKSISDHSLPLKPAQHLLPSSKDILLFPGKVQTFMTEKGEKLVVSDTGNNRILVIDQNGRVEHVIGGYNPGFEDGNFKEARFNAPQGVCVQRNIIYVADNENHAIRQIHLDDQLVTTIAGTGSQGHDYTGGKIGKDQELSSPWDVAIYEHTADETTVPVLLIAIAGTHQIWALFLEDTTWWKNQKYEAGTCIAIVGNGREQNRNNSYPHAASLAQPSGLAVAQEQKALFFADSESSSIRRVHLEDGKVSAVCGGDKNPSNLHCFGDTDGARYDVRLQHPLGVAWNPLEKVVYVADTYNHKIKEIDLSGHCKTLYGARKPNDAFYFDEPGGLAVDSTGSTLYVADTNNHDIKSIVLKTNEVSSVSIEIPKETSEKSNVEYVFDTSINTDGGELNITLDLAFENAKLNNDAPQRWSVIPPLDTWVKRTPKDAPPNLISLTVPKGEKLEVLCVTVDVIVCKTLECIPKRASVRFNVHRKSSASSVVNEEKLLVLD